MRTKQLLAYRYRIGKGEPYLTEEFSIIREYALDWRESKGLEVLELKGLRRPSVNKGPRR